MSTISRSSIEILLVEDNPADARLTLEALKEGKLTNYKNVNHVANGEQAISYLSRQAPYTDSVRPDLILLDINMPKVNGIEVLKYIRENDELRSLPVVVLTTSQSEEDVVKSYKLNANCYISKPVDLQSFIDIIYSIEHFWFDVVKLPPT